MKIVEECIAWLCLLACIKNPDKCPEYYLSMFGIYEGKNVDELQADHEQYIIWYNKESGGKQCK